MSKIKVEGYESPDYTVISEAQQKFMFLVSYFRVLTIIFSVLSTFKPDLFHSQLTSILGFRQLKIYS